LPKRYRLIPKQVAEDESAIQKISVRIAGLKRQMAGNPAELATVSAPFDGIILKMERKTLGDAVTDGQELCRIARSDCPLVAEISPPEEGLPRLQPGQPVRLFFQAFPYQRYGTAPATLRWMSPVALQSSEGERFVAHADLQSQGMQVQGAARPLQAGMRGESRIFVGRRSLIEYAFDPIP
jgi:multidrug efflux pump subunit AcrA (membrane-fusion protein)